MRHYTHILGHTRLGNCRVNYFLLGSYYNIAVFQLYFFMTYFKTFCLIGSNILFRGLSMFIISTTAEVSIFWSKLYKGPLYYSFGKWQHGLLSNWTKMPRNKRYFKSEYVKRKIPRFPKIVVGLTDKILLGKETFKFDSVLSFSFLENLISKKHYYFPGGVSTLISINYYLKLIYTLSKTSIFLKKKYFLSNNFARVKKKQFYKINKFSKINLWEKFGKIFKERLVFAFKKKKPISIYLNKKKTKKKSLIFINARNLISNILKLNTVNLNKKSNFLKTNHFAYLNKKNNFLFENNQKKKIILSNYFNVLYNNYIMIKQKSGLLKKIKRLVFFIYKRFGKHFFRQKFIIGWKKKKKLVPFYMDVKLFLGAFNTLNEIRKIKKIYRFKKMPLKRFISSRFKKNRYRFLIKNFLIYIKNFLIMNNMTILKRLFKKKNLVKKGHNLKFWKEPVGIRLMRRKFYKNKLYLKYHNIAKYLRSKPQFINKLRWKDI